MSTVNTVTDSTTVSTVTDFKHVHSSEQDYDYVTTDPKPNMKHSHDVEIHANPAYHASDVKMDANPAYHASDVKMDANSAYHATS